MEDTTHQDDAVQGGNASPEIINLLLADLGSKDGLVRVRARQSLVTIGEQAVGLLARSTGK